MNGEVSDKISCLALKSAILKEFLKDFRHSESLLRILQKDSVSAEKEHPILKANHYKIQVSSLVAGWETCIASAEKILQNINLELEKAKLDSETNE